MKRSNYTHNGMSYLIARGFKFYYVLNSTVLDKQIWVFRHSIHFQKLREWVNKDLEYYETNINEETKRIHSF